jgi:DNA-binding response OmpR family regulator
MHLLVVDDDAAVRASLRDALTADEVRVSEAAGGREALDLVRAGWVDVVLTDVRMPGVDGLELLRRVRALAPAVEVVLMTAWDDPDVRFEAARTGVRACLVKPLDLHILRALVEELRREHGRGNPFGKQQCTGE